MKTLPKIRIVSSKKDGTKIYQDDVEINLVVGYELAQENAMQMPIIKLEILAPIVEVDMEECEVEETIVEATEENTKKEIEIF